MKPFRVHSLYNNERIIRISQQLAEISSNVDTKKINWSDFFTQITSATDSLTPKLVLTIQKIIHKIFIVYTSAVCP